MAWITRGKHAYYSRHERHGGTVRRINLGRGPVAELAAVHEDAGAGRLSGKTVVLAP